MSIKIMAQVWEGGPDDRGELLVLLALADYANEKGECWPSVASIAKKARMEERSARRILRKLEASGWVHVNANAARHGCNQYLIKGGQNVRPDTMSPRTQTTAPPDTRVRPPRTPVSPEPSLNRQEPSAAAAREQAQQEQTDRDRYLEACGLDYTGMTGHGSARLGTAADMEVARKWTAAPPDGLGLTPDDCVKVISEVVARGATPRRFAYFDGAMSELAAARTRPVPKHKPRADAANTEPSHADRLSRWERLAKG